MFDKSRELKFPLSGGSSIPLYFRKPEIELATDTSIKNSIVVGGAADEGAIFHCVDVLQAFVDRHKGGETGVRSVQSIRGPETWNWSNALLGPAICSKQCGRILTCSGDTFSKAGGRTSVSWSITMGPMRRYFRAGVWAGPTPARWKDRKTRRSSRCLAGLAPSRSTTLRTRTSTGSPR